MNSILDADFVEIRRLSPGDGYQYFYGYYDNRAFHPVKKLHLCHRVSFMDRLPAAADLCELGVLNLETGEFHLLATTNAWNFQQGAMLEWNPGNSDEILYNVYQNGAYHGVVKNLGSGEERMLERPLSDISPNGRWGVSVNMSRVYDFRPGYGYCNIEDKWKEVSAPEDDGVFLVDMRDGKARQIIAYSRLAQIYHGEEEGLKDSKIVINHITFNRESNRFLFLIRYFPKEGGAWKTGIGTSDLEGTIYKLRPYTYASHYDWGKKGHLMLYGDCGQGDGLYVMEDQTQNYTVYGNGIAHEDIHCSYSPDGQWIIGDGYQDEEEYRPVYLYHIESGKGMRIGRFYSPHLTSVDIRCDLHCRWNLDGTGVSFDSIHEGHRGIYMMDLTKVMNIIKGGKFL